MQDSIAERNLAAVRTLCERWNTLDVAGLAAVMAEDCDYRNVPVDGDRHIGPAAAHAVLSRVCSDWEVTLVVRHIVGDANVVLAERDEHFVHRAGTKPSFLLPVMGTFEMRDGRIVVWRDYFELSHARFA